VRAGRREGRREGGRKRGREEGREGGMDEIRLFGFGFVCVRMLFHIMRVCIEVREEKRGVERGGQKNRQTKKIADIWSTWLFCVHLFGLVV
jgi:hypothetical protein